MFSRFQKVNGLNTQAKLNKKPQGTELSTILTTLSLFVSPIFSFITAI